MALQTRGFALSAMPTAPRIPDNVGVVDVKAIDEGVRRGLDTFEKLRRAPMNLILADEQGTTEIAKERAQQATIPTQTAAILADTPNRSSILAGQAQIAKRTLPLQEAQIGADEATLVRQAERRRQADVQLPEYLAAREAANGLASFQTSADDLAALPMKFPDVEAVYPEHGKTRAALETTARTSEENRLKRESAETIAGMRSSSAGGNDRLNVLMKRVSALRAAVTDNPGDDGLRADFEDADAALTKFQASSRADPTADRDARKDIAGNRITAAAQLSRDRNTALVTAARQRLETQQTTKAYGEALKKSESLQEGIAGLERLEDAAKDYMESKLGAGVFVGSAPILWLRALMGDESGNRFSGAIAQSMSTAVKALQGLGAMSQKEFDAAMDQLPKPKDLPETIADKLAHMGRLRYWLSARNEGYLKRLAAGDSPIQASQYVVTAFPMPADREAAKEQYDAATGAVSGPTAPASTDADEGARKWLRENPNHPRAAEARRALGL